MGRRIREGFVPGGKGRLLISADYSQIELRIMAHLSRDANLTAAFAADADVHRETAARVFGVSADLVSPEMRRQAKAVNFGVIYGISAFGLARNLRISRAEATRFIEGYFAQYPAVRTWLDATIAQARKQGYVTTLLGRRRYVSDLESKNPAARGSAERIATNTPVQGSAADIIKLAMIRLDAALREKFGQEPSAPRLLLQVHDELVLEADERDTESVAAMTRQIMEEAIGIDIPLKVDVGTGRNWAEIH
jgi:DNA polymerase-1